MLRSIRHFGIAGHRRKRAYSAVEFVSSDGGLPFAGIPRDSGIVERGGWLGHAALSCEA